MSHEAEKAFQFVIRDFETLKVLADPLRMQILTLLARPRTVKELGERLEMPPTKLYYHVHQLMKANLIAVAETNIVSGIIEKRYVAAAEEYRVDPELLSPKLLTEEYVENLLAVVFDSTKKDIRRSVATGTLDLRTDPDQAQDRVIARLYVDLSPGEFARFRAKLAGLLAEVSTAAASGAGKGSAEHGAYGLTVAFYPLPFVDDESKE